MEFCSLFLEELEGKIEKKRENERGERAQFKPADKGEQRKIKENEREEKPLLRVLVIFDNSEVDTNFLSFLVFFQIF